MNIPFTRFIATVALVCALNFLPNMAWAATIDLKQDQLSPETFNPATIVKTANRLIALGNADAYAACSPTLTARAIPKLGRTECIATTISPGCACFFMTRNPIRL